MALRVEVVRYGREAAETLRDRIAAAKGSDPLAPVTVIVPHGYVGLSMRRLLASGDLGPAAGTNRTGVINVTFTTLPRLAEQLGGATLAAAGRRPLSSTVLHSAVRAALAVDPGVFGPVRSHPSTEASLTSLWRDLRGVGPASLDKLAAANDRTAHVVRLVGDVSERVHDWYDEHDLVTAATATLDDAELLVALIVHLPSRVPPHHEKLITAIGARTDTTVLMGATGDPDADAWAREQAERMRAEAEFPEETIAPTKVVSAPSADVEVLHALRILMARHRDGTPLDRMAVVYGPGEPYARLLHEQLEVQGIPFNGPGVRSLAHNVAGRTLLGALELPDVEWQRDAVIDWLSTAPIRSDGRPIPTAAWDRLTRAAGITRGIESWERQLARYRADQADKHEQARSEDDTSATTRHFDREVAHVDRVAGFLDWLRGQLDPESPPGGWDDWTRWARRFLLDTTGGPAGRQSWPDEEVRAFDEVLDALNRLGVLDDVEAPPDRATFRRALAGDLAATAPQTTRFGRGLLVGRVSTVVGLDLDLVIVLGMADGAFPVRTRDDTLLPDGERAAAGSDIPLRAVRAAELHHTYLAALRAAREQILMFPRGDLRSGRVQRPSRWWLDGLARVTQAGHTLYSRDLETLESGGSYQSVASHTAAVRAAGEPAGPDDHDLRLLLRRHDGGDGPAGHWLTDAHPVLRAGLALRAGRRSRDYTRFDGRAGPLERGERPTFSATALETYATCPRRYLLSKVLYVEAPAKPERVTRIQANDRGSLVHKVLEKFFERQTALARSDRIQPGQRWGEDDHETLDRLFDEVAAGYVETGRTGHRLMWELDQRRIRRDLHSMLEADDDHRDEHGAIPHAVELPFGTDGTTPVTITLPDGREVGFRGYIDRLDVTAAGGAVVRDYKVGKDSRYKPILEDPVDRGRRMQPVIYGLAARLVLRDPAAPVETGYWFTVEAGGFRAISVPCDDMAVTRFEEALRILLDGIEGGHFPGRPGGGDRDPRENCEYCDYDSLCPAGRVAQWQHAATDPALAPYVDLADGTGGPGLPSPAVEADEEAEG